MFIYISDHNQSVAYHICREGNVETLQTKDMLDFIYTHITQYR